MATVNFEHTRNMEAIKIAFEDFNIALQTIDPALWADDIVVQGRGANDEFCKVYYVDGEVMIDGLGNEVL